MKDARQIALLVKWDNHEAEQESCHGKCEKGVLYWK